MGTSRSYLLTSLLYQFMIRTSPFRISILWLFALLTNSTFLHVISTATLVLLLNSYPIARIALINVINFDKTFPTRIRSASLREWFLSRRKQKSTFFSLYRKKKKYSKCTNLYCIKAIWNTRMKITAVLKLGPWHTVEHIVDFIQCSLPIGSFLFGDFSPFWEHGHHRQSAALCGIIDFPLREEAANRIPKTRLTEDCIVILVPCSCRNFKENNYSPEKMKGRVKWRKKRWKKRMQYKYNLKSKAHHT